MTTYAKNDKVRVTATVDTGRIGMVTAVIPQSTGRTGYIIQYPDSPYKPMWYENDLELVEKAESEEVRR